MFGLPYLLLPLPPLVVRSDLSEEIDGGNWLFKIGIEYLVKAGKRRILPSSVRVAIFLSREESGRVVPDDIWTSPRLAAEELFEFASFLVGLL